MVNYCRFLENEGKLEKENVFESQLFISILRRKVAHLQPYTELVTTAFSGVIRRKSIHNKVWLLKRILDKF